MMSTRCSMEVLTHYITHLKLILHSMLTNLNLIRNLKKKKKKHKYLGHLHSVFGKSLLHIYLCCFLDQPESHSFVVLRED